MKILLVSELIPKVHIYGATLPTEKHFEYLSQVFDVEFLLIHESRAYFDKHKHLIGDSFVKIHFLQKNKPNGAAATLAEVFQGRSRFLNHSYQAEEVKQLLGSSAYDWIWAASIGAMSFVRYSIKLNFLSNTKVGLSALDITTYAMRNVGAKLKASDYRWLPFLSLMYMRSFFIEKEEKSVMSLCDIVHLVSENEKAKAIKFFQGKNEKPTFIVAPNGRNSNLENISYSGKSNVLIFMTNLESTFFEPRWFFKRVWPKIRAATDAEVWLIGPKPNKVPVWLTDTRIHLKGRVDKLGDTLAHARIFILPIHHAIGYVNRLADGFVAGLPIATTSYPMTMFNEKIDNVPAAIADDPAVLADKIIELYRNENIRNALAQKAREFGLENIVDWQSASRIIEQAIRTASKP